MTTLMPHTKSQARRLAVEISLLPPVCRFFGGFVGPCTHCAKRGVISITPDLVNAEYPLVVVQRALYRMYEASGMSVWRKLCTDMPATMNVVEHLMFDPVSGSPRLRIHSY
jgi:hypothetical protein